MAHDRVKHDQSFWAQHFTQSFTHNHRVPLEREGMKPSMENAPSISHMPENLVEMIAYRSLQDIAAVKDSGKTKKEILDRYAECRQAVCDPEDRLRPYPAAL